MWCPACGNKADEQRQPGFGRIPDLLLETCWEPSCPLKQTTLTDTDYRDFARPVAERSRDLSDYGLPIAVYDPMTGEVMA